jgi:apolipoprotein N-acyltransferase
VPLAAWLSPFFLLHFTRGQPAAPGILLAWAVLFVVSTLANRRTLPVRGAASLGLSFIATLMLLVPFVADRLLYFQLPGILSPLVYPLAGAVIELFCILFSPSGSWGSLAYTQYDNLAFSQVASVTGIAGITFLVNGTASVAEWAWRSGFGSGMVTWGVLAWAGLLAAVFIAGALRLSLARTDGSSVRAAVLSYPKEIFAPGEMTRIQSGRVAPEDNGGAREKLARLQDWFLENTRREARAGARIVAWPETNLVVFKEDEEAFLQAAKRVAAEEHLHLLMGMATVSAGARRPLENKAILLTPDGGPAFSHVKSRLAAGWEASVAIKGDENPPAWETAIGRIGSAICFEADHPRLLRQKNGNEADLLIVPANDWREIKDTHLRMAAFRSIENGVPMLRATSSGLSAAIDAYGRFRSLADHFTPGLRVMVAQVPLGRVRTVYAKVGNLFAWLCAAGLAAMIVRAMAL